MSKSKRVFLVDDNIVNLKTGKRILEDYYTVIPISSGKKLLEILNKFYADIIILDIEMPEMDGYEVLKELKKNPLTADIPVVLLSNQDDNDDKQKGFSLGAVEYINKPFSKPLLCNRIDRLLLIEQQKADLNEFIENLRTVASEHNETVESMQRAILLWTADLLEFRTGTDNGSREKVQLCLKVILTEMLNLDLYAEEITSWDVAIDTIVSAATLHDIGKIRVPVDILQKLRTLSSNEYEEIKQHATYGKSLIETLKNRLHNQKFLDYAQTMAFLHHEKWDGTGYPLGLKETEIPLLARVMAIVDVYNALTSNRPYKAAISHEDALKTIESQQGIQFDPQLVTLFLSVSDKLREIKP